MKNEGMVTTLRNIGGATIILGVIACLALLAQFSKPSLFSSGGELSGVELGIAFAVAFYHAILGILCFGVAQSLAESTRAAEMGENSYVAGKSVRAPQVTECSKCGQSFAGDLRGQFCESCGEKL